MKKIDPELISKSSGIFIRALYDLLCQVQKVLFLLRHFWAAQLLTSEQVSTTATSNRRLLAYRSTPVDGNINFHLNYVITHNLKYYHNPILLPFKCWKDIFKDQCSYCALSANLFQYGMLTLHKAWSIHKFLLSIIIKLAVFISQVETYYIMIYQCDNHYNCSNRTAFLRKLHYNYKFANTLLKQFISYGLAMTISVITLAHINAHYSLVIGVITAKRHCSYVEGRVSKIICNV